jgi:hypothetical protein
MARTYQPFLGNFSNYGELGPEHMFFLEGLLAGDPTVNGDPTVPPGSNSYDASGYNEGSPGGTGGGQAGLGIGAGLGDDGRSATANESTTTTNSAVEFGMSVAAATNPALATLATLANIGLNKNEEPTKMGFRGFAQSALGLDKNPQQSFNDFAETSDLNTGVTDQSFAGFAETSDLYGGSDTGGAGSDVGGGGGDNGGGVDGGGPGGSGTGGQARGGLIRRYAEGGYLPGDTGGMDDSVPAMIDGMEPAALSDGEFVIPADVVAMLGDGNSGAGAKKIEQAISKIRKTKYGRDKQPPKMQRSLADLLA